MRQQAVVCDFVEPERGDKRIGRDAHLLQRDLQAVDQLLQGLRPSRVPSGLFDALQRMVRPDRRLLQRGADVRAGLAHLGELFGRMHRAGRPGQADVGEPVAIRDHAAEGLVGRHAVGAPAVQRRDQSVQLVALLLQVAGGGRPMFLGDEIALAPSRRKLLQHARLLRLGGVDLETVVAESDARSCVDGRLRAPRSSGRRTAPSCCAQDSW